MMEQLCLLAELTEFVVGIVGVEKLESAFYCVLVDFHVVKLHHDITTFQCRVN